ncbi:MAG: hypothetical protein LC777_14090 [Actinobacteria bacterium]|nr:hypothetical protein [Actinomycetota bacterium]
MAVPATASAALVRVVPYVEPPLPPGNYGCGKYMNCPEDMMVFTAAPGEANDLSIVITADVDAPGRPARSRYLVRDRHFTPMQAGAGCERVEQYAVACTAETLGPVELGDLGDRITSPMGGGDTVSGGAGDDVLDVAGVGEANGGKGDDVVIARNGNGGLGDDVLLAGDGGGGEGGPGNDVLRCFQFACNLNGGAGNDQLIGIDGPGMDTLSGGGGRDFLSGRGGNDDLFGGPGNDRLRGGAGKDVLRGGAGDDTLESRELRSLGERTAKDDVNCGAGRRDRAVVDRRDEVTRCERVARSRRRAR